jgi:hypothetical protein
MATTPGDQFIIRGNADNNKRLLLGYDTTSNRASLQSYTAASTAGPLLLNPSGGNVGIGSATVPSVALDVTGAIKASGDLTAANISVGQLTASGDLTAANISVGQLSASSRVMTNSLEFWGSGGPGGALWQKSATTFFTNTTAANGETVLMGSPKLHLATANGGAAVMTLSGSNVGIGKATPSVALDVTGAVTASTAITAGTTIAAGTTITAGGKTVPTSDENNLKIIRGTVKTDGFIVYGSGFTVVKVPGQTGLYQITFTTPFSSSPSVTTSITGRYGIKAEVYNPGRTSYPNNSTDGLYPGATGFTVGVLNSTSEVAYNFGFQFIAIGPR